MTTTRNILDTIVQDKVDEVRALKAATSYEALRDQARALPPARDFHAAIRAPGRFRIIAEIKRASPSKGIIREDFDAPAIARDYDAHGASALSVLTDAKHFQGSLDTLRAVRAVTDLPLLRKDFLIDPLQVAEARLAGADAVFFIAAIWDRPEPMARLLDAAKDCGLCAFIEVHTAGEARLALEAGAAIIGINNRDLKTFDVSLETTFTLKSGLPDGMTVISESGIHTPADLRRLQNGGVHAALVGEHFMRAPSPGQALRALLDGLS